MKKIQKILVVGYFSSDPQIYTYATSFYNNFQKLGYDVDAFDYRQSFPVNLLKNFFVNFLLLKKALKFKPDLIFFVKAETIFPKTLIKLKAQLGAYLVNFYPDNPFVFWNGNSNANVLNSLPIYDCFLIWSKMLQPVLESACCKNVYYFPFAFDQDLFPEKIEISEYDHKKYSCDVCFAGTWDSEREFWLTNLCQKKPDLNLAIWGNMWQEKLSQDSILREKITGNAIYGYEMIKLFRCSKIVLNFIRRQNSTSHNMRTFEIPASNAFMLTERTSEQTEILFKEDENIACFASIEELSNKINCYLINENLRKILVEKGFRRAQKFTMQNSLQEFMQYFENLTKRG